MRRQMQRQNLRRHKDLWIFGHLWYIHTENFSLANKPDLSVNSINFRPSFFSGRRERLCNNAPFLLHFFSFWYGKVGKCFVMKNYVFLPDNSCFGRMKHCIAINNKSWVDHSLDRRQPCGWKRRKKMYIEEKKTKDRLVLVPEVPQNERKKN